MSNTMSLLLHRKLLPHLSLPFTKLTLHPRLLSSSSPATQTPPPTPHFITDYLITTCGLPPDKAAEASKHLAAIKSPNQPDAVLNLLRSHGFSQTQIKKLISCHPRTLRLDAAKTLTPKLQTLKSIGFSPSDLPHLIVSSPCVLLHRTVLPKIQLWRSLLGSTDNLMKLLRDKNQWLLTGSLEKTILPNLAFLRSRGILDDRISMVVKNHPRFILQKPARLRAHAELVEGLGIPCASRMFLWALQAVRMVSGDRFKAKVELMKKFGWSELEFLAAFRKAPVFLSVSEGMMRKKMDFLVNEVGLEPSVMAQRPRLLMYSLENRLVPRYRVLKILKSKGLRGGNYNLHSIMDVREKEFVEKFLLCHKEVPELYQVYVAGSGVDGAL